MKSYAIVRIGIWKINETNNLLQDAAKLYVTNIGVTNNVMLFNRLEIPINDVNRKNIFRIDFKIKTEVVTEFLYFVFEMLK